jgi:hypothetical protein
MNSVFRLGSHSQDMYHYVYASIKKIPNISIPGKGYLITLFIFFLVIKTCESVNIEDVVLSLEEFIFYLEKTNCNYLGVMQIT